jgi:predicted enzyme related to lactoylglutathione lyase
MRVRSSYFKVSDMEREVAFWQALLQLEPAKKSSHWSEFKVGEVRIGFLLNDFGEELKGCACVPVIEFEPEHLQAAITRAKNTGASVVLDGLANPKMNSIVLASPGGHEFELCNCVAHQ